MTNITVSVPEDLKSKMDQMADVNWSEVARNGFAQYIRGRESQSPPIQYVVRTFTFANDMEKDAVLRIGVQVRNNSDAPLAIDRMSISGNIGGWYVAPQYRHEMSRLEKNAEGNLQLDLKISPTIAISLMKNIKASFRCELTIVTYCNGYAAPHQFGHNEKVTIEEWNNYLRSFIEPSLKEHAKALSSLLELKT